MRATAAPRPGFFGKLPVIGDFVSRRLPREFIDGWDHWLQRGLAASRENRMNIGPDSCFSGPIWRFALNPGIRGPNAWLGILAPSADRVGRYFPLTIAVPVQNSKSLPDYFRSSDEWFDQIEALALSAVQNSLAVDEIDVRSQRLLLPITNGCPIDAHPITKIKNSRGAPSPCISLDSTEQMAVDALGGFPITTLAPEYSLWCTAGAEQISTSLLVCNGLPSSHDFAKFLIGDARQYASNLEFEHASRSDRNNTGRHLMPTTVSADPPVNENDDQPLLNDFQWESAGLTNADKGNSDRHDAFLEKSKIGLWAITDCASGQQDGNIADKMFIDSLDRVEASADLEDLMHKAMEALHSANTDLVNQREQEYGDEITGRSIVVLLTTGNRCAYLRAGNCRLYLYRRDKLMQLTPDHGDSDELNDFGSTLLGLLDDSESRTQRLTNQTSASEQLDLDTAIHGIEDHDIFLLCSQALITKVSPQEIENVLARDNCRAGAENLADLAVRRGTRDKLNLIIARTRAAD